jgi:hypothetical protein
MNTENARTVTAFTFHQVTYSTEDEDFGVLVLNYAPCHERMEKWLHNYINYESQHWKQLGSQVHFPAVSIPRKHSSVPPGEEE